MPSTPVPRARARPAAAARGEYARSSATRERIFVAALEVARESGLHRASVARIAERAGVAVGNLHYHFGSREGLLRALMEWVVVELRAEVERVVDPANGYFDNAEAALRAYLAYVHKNPGYVRLAEEARLHYPELYQKGITMWLAGFRQALARGIERGELRDMTPAEIAAQAHFLMGARYFLDQMIEGAGGVDYPGDDAVVEAYLELVRRGLERRP